MEYIYVTSQISTIFGWQNRLHRVKYRSTIHRYLKKMKQYLKKENGWIFFNKCWYFFKMVAVILHQVKDPV